MLAISGVIGVAVGIYITKAYQTAPFANTADAIQMWTIYSSIGTCLGSIAAVIGVFIAARSFRSQVQQSKITLGADMLFKLTETFDSDRMRETRYRASIYLNSSLKRSTVPQKNPYIDQVLDFFEQVALLERRGAIETEFVWHAFYEWVFYYYHLTKPYRADARVSDESTWADFEILYGRIQALQGSNAPTSPTHSEMVQFLNNEQA